MKSDTKTRTSPLWYLWKLWFPSAPMNRVFIAWGDTIYCPKGEQPTEDLLVHERTHLRQQSYSKWEGFWWHLAYRFSKNFRYAQELEAYQNQWQWFLNNKTVQFSEKMSIRKKIAQVMSSPMYGNMCSYEQAYKEVNESPNPKKLGMVG